jgi:hypothetical protein
MAHPLVHGLFLALFDIDKGSVLKHRWPADALESIPDDFFSECMLPEGAHNRSGDETTNFLNRKDGPVMYFLSVVSTRRDASLRRGALVKAIAIATPFQQLSVFRNPLTMALNSCLEGAADDLVILQQLFYSLNQVNLSFLPHPSPVSRQLMWRGVTDGTGQVRCGAPHEHQPANHTWAGECHFRGKLVELSFPLYTSPDETVIVDNPILSQLCSTLLPDQTMRLYHALIVGSLFPCGPLKKRWR